MVTGGAGHVGCVLVPKLLRENYRVIVLDTMFFGDEGLKDLPRENLEIIKGDIRDKDLVDRLTRDVDGVIHLAAISNDPSSELDPKLTEEVNHLGTVDLVRISKENGVKRFINVSSSSVYGIKNEPKVTEDLKLEPLTIYSKTKAWAEEEVKKYNDENFTTVNIRPATVCGYSPRMRLDLVVNILTAHAIMNRKIIVFGGKQKRPNIHIQDITDLYVEMLKYSDEKISGEVFNAGYENHTVMELAEMVREVVGDDVEIEIQPTNDPRSYHISSEKLTRVTGFKPKRTIRDAIIDVKEAFEDGRISNWKDPKYYNVKRMKEIEVK